MQNKMKQMFLMFIVFFGILMTCYQACDIFVMSKCPVPSPDNVYNNNYTLYCKGIKDHVDCINKKLKTCKMVQEYGPALETIKWNIKVIIQQGRNHGCEDLIDKIKLPRIPRKKPTTTTKLTTTELITEKTVVYINPNCKRSLVDMYCEKLDYPLNSYLFNNTLTDSYLIANSFFVDEPICKALVKFSTCLQTNFKSKCAQSFSEAFSKLDKLNAQCANIAKKLKPSSSNSNTSFNFIKVYSISFCFLALSFSQFKFFTFYN